MVAMENKKGNKKWKDALLHSGLPLESLVAEKLGQHDFEVAGEYSYIRQNEQDANTQFSVDLLARRQLIDYQDGRWADLHLLIECKYRRRGVKWIFSPHPLPDDSNMGIVTVNQALCTKRITYESLLGIYKGVQHCLRGAEFQDGSKKANPKEISHGLSQLRYAIPNLVWTGLCLQSNARSDEELHIQIVCPMLVTTAKLYVLKRGLDLESFDQASKLEDVAQECNTLIVKQSPGPQISKYSESLFNSFLAANPKTVSYLIKLGEILGNAGWPADTIPNVDTLHYTILSSSRLILLMNYNALYDLWFQMRLFCVILLLI